ncbi:MAG: hypothetical protein L0H83_02715, partial [Salinisphaera sp.]|nr:hypothetical protein [Salinisphaera sp.]
MTTSEQSPALLARWAALREQQSGLRTRNAAAALGVSEGELVAARCGDGVMRLTGDVQHLLKGLEPVGEVMALTRNEFAVHERHGRYHRLYLRKTGGVAVGEEIDLRYFFNNWCHGFAVREAGPRGSRESLQYFDRDGTAVHKIYRTQATDDAAWRALVAHHAHPDQTPGLAPAAPMVGYVAKPLADIDMDGLRADWSALADTHAFYPMLKRPRIERIDAMRNIGPGLARSVPTQGWQDAIARAARTELPIMVFVGSPGVVQIHGGTVERLLRRDGWFNVLDPRFNLHVREQAITECWAVFKPNRNEGLDADHAGVTS